MAFKFPSVIQYDGLAWHLIYAPDVENMLPPNLEGAVVQSLTCDPVKVPNRQQPMFLTMLDIVFPARQDPSGKKVVGEKKLKAFRLYDTPPYDPSQVKPIDCSFYLAAPQGAGESAAQRLLNAVMGACHEDAQKDEADASWCDALAKLQTQEVACVEGDTAHTEER